MEKMTYYPTMLEKWISDFYRKRGINTPDDLDPYFISDNLGIMYIEEPRASYSVEQDDFKMINVNSNLADQDKKTHFYHELCHVLRHYGNQLMMPKAFRELQERDARHFTLYASIPFHMLHDYNFRDENIARNLAIDFNVEYQLAHERVERIFRNAISRQKYVI